MRHTEFWARMDEALGAGLARHWAQTHVLGALEGRTVVEALDAGVAPKQVWAVVWQDRELPARLK